MTEVSIRPGAGRRSKSTIGRARERDEGRSRMVGEEQKKRHTVEPCTYTRVTYPNRTYAALTERSEARI